MTNVKKLRALYLGLLLCKPGSIFAEDWYTWLKSWITPKTIISGSVAAYCYWRFPRKTDALVLRGFKQEPKSRIYDLRPFSVWLSNCSQVEGSFIRTDPNRIKIKQKEEELFSATAEYSFNEDIQDLNEIATAVPERSVIFKFLKWRLIAPWYIIVPVEDNPKPGTRAFVAKQFYDVFFQDNEKTLKKTYLASLSADLSWTKKNLKTVPETNDDYKPLKNQIEILQAKIKRVIELNPDLATKD